MPQPAMPIKLPKHALLHGQPVTPLQPPTLLVTLFTPPFMLRLPFVKPPALLPPPPRSVNGNTNTWSE